ncbi:sphingomyelin phosphodiesterase 4-like isoform X2 [Stegodyphus dumicola]|nr:sphingomyelin phosphodiesterase 4-like isoform X2 [Stegodyphus dumicola]XP_035218871.1 sphingomyelin phosphodiesterase 4-like isoform X2 [Stegodyphus dumicola]
MREFETLKRFMAPDGPLLRLVFKFVDEFSPKFEFPISCLPIPSQRLLQEGKIPHLYANKLQAINPGLPPSSLQLNAFEFYFFHYAYFIVNPTLKSSFHTVNQQETLYAHLLEDYLFYFLPTEGRAVPLYQTPSNVQHSPILTSSLSSNCGSPHVTSDHLQSYDVHINSHARPDFLSPLRTKPSLLKKGTVLMVASPGSGSSYFANSAAESWKSETFLLILKEIYLNQNSLDQQQNAIDLIPKIFVPTHYHVWMVRILVKHLHFFFNSSLLSNQTSGHGQIMIDSLGRLKSLGMTQLIQKEMYCLLKSTFDHWPLDASFRVPLETWLSYIQPWRYIHCDLEPSVWQKFVNENILFYTSIFQQVLRRFLRMDLNCPKNAYMLFRLTKVFSTGELRDMIMQAERGSVSKPSDIGMHNSFIHRSPEKFSFTRKISQLEVPGSTYTPLFSEPVFMMVTHLLSAISVAREKALIQDVCQHNISRSFFDQLSNVFKTYSDGYNSDENNPADIRKVASYLEASSQQLCQFFREVLPPPINTSSVASQLGFTTAGPSTNNNVEKIHQSKFHELSVDEKLQLLNKKKKPDVTYWGNPDLQPVRTYEIAFLVKIFNEISQHLNEKYSSEIQNLYNQPTIWGKMCRRMLSKPVIYYNVNKASNMQSVSMEPVQLPPRINLRFLANKQLIFYLFILLLTSYWFGYHPILTMLLLSIILFLFLFLSALIWPVPIGRKDD